MRDKYNNYKTKIKIMAKYKKWTFEDCFNEAQKYRTKGEWYKNHKTTYQKACREGWLYRCCKHMVRLMFEKCFNEARKYGTRSEWSKNHSSTYTKARKKGWLDECCQHMIRGYNRWTFEQCFEEAKKHVSRSEWYENDRSTYDKARKEKWLDECCEHMGKSYKVWTFEQCLKEAEKYKSRTEWAMNHIRTYDKARREGWLDGCCGHMTRHTHPLAYVYIFRNSFSIKIGISAQPHIRIIDVNESYFEYLGESDDYYMVYKSLFTRTNAYKIEKKLHKLLKNYQMFEIGVFDGATECFCDSLLNEYTIEDIINIIEVKKLKLEK